MEQQQHIYEVVQKIITTQGEIVTNNSIIKITIKQQSQTHSIPHEIIVGHQQVHRNLENVILQMRVGQQWQVKHIFNQKSTLINIFIKQIIGNAGEQQKPIQKALKAKDEGTALYKNGDLKSARVKYQQGYSLIQYDFNQQAAQLRLSLMSNAALMHLNLKQFQLAIKWCKKYEEEAFEINKKIKYRIANAYRQMKSWTQAKAQIQFALQRWTDKQTQEDFNKLKATLLADEKKQIEQQKAVYSKMFG